LGNDNKERVSISWKDVILKEDVPSNWYTAEYPKHVYLFLDSRSKTFTTKKHFNEDMIEYEFEFVREQLGGENNEVKLGIYKTEMNGEEATVTMWKEQTFENSKKTW
jgi:hypothetical protein